MKKWIFVLALSFISSAAFSFDHSHAQFTEVLKKYNKDGLINYKDLKSNPESLNAYLKSLKNVSPVDFKTWSQNEKLAFWINAYNANTLKAIIDNHPIQSSFLKGAIYPKNSIRQINGVWDKIKFGVLGKEMTLNEIEHDTIRKNFKEPRIHMALVCAALGCPRLRTEAYEASRLQEQLSDDAQRFLKLPFQFKIDQENNIVYLSSIFKWFGDDFLEKHGSVINFIIKNVNEADAAYLKKGTFETKYLDYDWTLNELQQ